MKNLTKLAALLLFPIAARAEVTLPKIFADHMVLQRDAPIHVWGWATPGERITVTFANKKSTATTTPDGHWKLDLPKLPADATPQTFTVSGTNTITLSDVLVGDVWVASGQSNMERLVNETDHTDADLATANDTSLRIFHVLPQSSVTPREDLGLWRGTRGWEVSDSTKIMDFSAVAFFFGRELRKDLNIPIALIDTTQGGTRAQIWVSLEGMQQHVKEDPEFQGWIDKRQQVVDHLTERQAAYPAAKAKYDADLKQWNDKMAADPVYSAQVKTYNEEFALAVKEGRKHPGKPRPPTPTPVAPELPDVGYYSAYMVANLYNTMIAPLTPLSIKGVLWYQGESNDSNAKQYRTLFPLMITDWRNHWHQDNLPFLFVQLPNIYAPAATPVVPKDPWPPMREAQAQALLLPNTGMVTTIDIGDPWDVHGKDKGDIGIRMSYVARHQVYGEKIVDEGPTYQSMKPEGNKLSVKFTSIGTGMIIGAAPWTPTHVLEAPASELRGFAIAGADKKWFWAKAEIHGDHVTVWSDDVPKPVAIRYDWADNPPGNLYNREKLPAAPFRTDDWPL